MKFIKKFAAILLTVLLVAGTVITAGAADTKTTFEMNVVSETNSQVTVEFSLVRGSFSSIDLAFQIGGNVSACTRIETADGLAKWTSDHGGVMSAQNEKTGKVCIVSTNQIDTPISLVRAVFAKKASASVTEKDVKAVVSNCAISLDNGEIVLITDAITVTNNYSARIQLSSNTMEVNYKASFNLSNVGSYSGNIVWSSSDESVAKVDENGKVTAVGKGTATITAASPDGTTVDTCKVSVSYAWWQMLIRIVLLGFLWY